PFGSSGYARLVQSGADTLLQIDRNGTTSGANYATLAVLENVTASQLVAANFEGFAALGVAFLGTSNSDRLTGTDGSDSIYGFDGDDTLVGGAGNDGLIGGTGNDTYFVDAGDTVYESVGQGYDTVAASVSYILNAGASVELLTTGWIDGTAAINLTGNELANQIWGNNGSNVLSGDDGDDALFGFGGSDTLIGGAGNDAIFGGEGADVAIGGLGNDTIYVDDAGDTVVERAGEGYDTVAAGFDYKLNADADVELLTTGWIGGTAAIALTGSDSANEIWGNNGANILNGGAGNDVLLGFDGDDTLVGGAGNDGLIGGTGNDTYFVDAGDTVYESVGQGYDTVAASVSYILNAGASVELLTTGWIDGTAAINLTGNELANQIWGNNGSNVLSGDDGDDALFGFGGSDTLIGGAGNDAIFGGEGADVAIGGLGNDTIYVDDAGDTVVERAGEGYDTVAAGFDYKLNADADVELLTTGWIGGTAAIALTGSDSANEIWGNNGANILNGGAGNDVLVGFDGDDTLVGGAGNDGLIGGSGNDTYLFDTALGRSNIDTIYGFTSGQDRVALDRKIFEGLNVGTLSASAFAVGTSASDADDRIIYNPATGALLFDADGSGSGSAYQFAIFDGNSTLSANDFFVI
ncbi:calcium-binding protein, partial [Sphingomonas paucimobilis]|uniref:calcium-binding protein n=2 Tax=Sphingomonas TaxID=13687 RepID=UPI0024355E1D